MRLFLSSLSSLRSCGLSPELYVRGATFPSTLSFAYRFSGQSWRGALNEAGFDAWALDFYGFGGSDLYPEIDEVAHANGPLCLAADAVDQLEAAVRFILHESRAQRVSLVTHSWGSMPAGLLAAAHPALVDRLFLFAPLAERVCILQVTRDRDQPVSAHAIVERFGVSERFVYRDVATLNR